MGYMRGIRLNLFLRCLGGHGICKHIVKPKLNMKKVMFAAVVLFALAVSVSSCKSKEKCEAYSSKAEPTETKHSY